ncbi:transposase [Pseudorhodoplanes sinuspersici]|nr:transposase [Pseudorhodoplanes sinuspersici]
MPRKRHSAEQIVAKLRQIDVLVAQGRTIAQACKEAEISEQSFYRWRNEYGGLEMEQAKRFKELERERSAQAVGRRSVPGEADPEGCR